jgi:hypothetical protein
MFVGLAMTTAFFPVEIWLTGPTTYSTVSTPQSRYGRYNALCCILHQPTHAPSALIRTPSHTSLLRYSNISSCCRVLLPARHPNWRPQYAQSRAIHTPARASSVTSSLVHDKLRMTDLRPSGSTRSRTTNYEPNPESIVISYEAKRVARRRGFLGPGSLTYSAGAPAEYLGHCTRTMLQKSEQR